MKLTIADRVKKLLIDKPNHRDSDNKLIASVWWVHIGGKNIEKMSAKDLLQQLADGKLPSSESIRRSRQKLQEELPELRGSTYKHRQTVEEQETREEIRNFEA